jgi:hypothetical protein
MMNETNPGNDTIAEMYARYDPQALPDFAGSVEKSISKRFKINARDTDADAKFIEEIIEALDRFVDSLDPNAHLDGQVAKLRAERSESLGSTKEEARPDQSRRARRMM